MTIITVPGGRSMYVVMAQFRRDLGVNYQTAVDTISGILNRYADADGVIPPQRIPQVLAEVDKVVSGLFVGADGRNPFASDGVTPLSPYARLLNQALVDVTLGPVQGQSDLIARAAPDVLSWLSQAKPPTVRNFAPDYSAPHEWIDPNGYSLSDRIWRAGMSTRLKMDGLLSDGIRQGTSAKDLSSQLERFLLPDRANLRTDKPYGVNASFDGMRLARTEITRAHGAATMAAGDANPFVDGTDWALSPSHIESDTCNDNATIDASGNRVAEPYAPGDVPLYPEHPQCVLPGQMVSTNLGYVPIENIEPGDVVLTHKGGFKSVKSAWGDFYEGAIYRIGTNQGSIEITPEHPVMTLRGWVNAEDLKLTDYVLNASFNIGFDSDLSVMKDGPSQDLQASVPNSIFFGSMPIDTVALNSDIMSHQREIQSHTFNSVLSHEVDPMLGQRFSHCSLDNSFPVEVVEALHGTEPTLVSIAGFNLKSPPAIKTCDEFSVLKTHPAHDKKSQTGVIKFLRSGNLSTDSGAFGRVGIAYHAISESMSLFNQSLRECLVSCPVIFYPLQLCALMTCTQRYIAMIEQISNYSEWDAELFANIGSSEQFSEIKPNQNVFDRLAVFEFDAFYVPEQSMSAHAIPATFPPSGFAANQTRLGEILTHDNLLLLSPDFEVGAASGNAVVRRVINPPQAHLHYTAIRSISVREYTGFVYNMHVDTDNSYVINEMAVHNCMCNLRAAVTQSVGDVVSRLRAQIANGDEPPFTPADPRVFVRVLLGAKLADIGVTA